MGDSLSFFLLVEVSTCITIKIWWLSMFGFQQRRSSTAAFIVERFQTYFRTITSDTFPYEVVI